MSTDPKITRRALLGAATLMPLAACSPVTVGSPSPGGTTSGASTSDSQAAQSASPTPATVDDHLTGLESKFDARLGLFALAPASGNVLVHRADERFAFCSTFKGLAAAAVLYRNHMSHLQKVVTYDRDDLMSSSMITRKHVDKGMTIGQLCDAAVRYSDGTAGNLLLRDLGGPKKLNAYLRELGDSVTRMDRMEPNITTAVPGDPRDTSTPRALGADYLKIVIGDALTGEKRAFLRRLMERNTTGEERIKAVLPKGWSIANKTGTGDFGTVNDIAVVWPARARPVVLSIMSSKASRDAEYKEALVAEAADYALTTIA